MSKLTYLRNLIKDTISSKNYDSFNLKQLFIEFFSCVEKTAILPWTYNAHLLLQNSVFNETDYLIGREREEVPIYGQHWGYFFDEFKVIVRTELDVLIRQDEKTRLPKLVLSGFQKRMIRDKSDRYNWSYYTRIFENLEKTELKEEINYDDTCEINIYQATLADFLLYKDLLEEICNKIESN